ncbi:MAG: hypothetical protein AB1831_10215 [Pseudomonadota bacterium]
MPTSFTPALSRLSARRWARRARQGGGGGDVIGELDLLRADEVLAGLVDAPGAVVQAADAQVARLQLAAVELELVAGVAVHHVDVEVLAPGVPVALGGPFLAVEALDHEHQGADVVGDAGEPGVVGVGVIVRGGEQLDHRAHGALRREQGAGVGAVRARDLEAVAVVALEQLLHLVEVALQVLHVVGAGEQRGLQRLGDLRLAAAGHRARLVAEHAFRLAADQAPGRRVGVLLEADLEAVGVDVGVPCQQLEAARGAALRAPGDLLFQHVEVGVLGQVDHVGPDLVDAVALRMKVDQRGVARLQLGERVAAGAVFRIQAVAVAEVEAGEGEGAARVFLLRAAEQVGGVGDLRLDLLLGVSEVVVGDDRDDHAIHVAAHHLEGGAVVVFLVLVLPAHAVAALPLGGLVPVRQAHGLLGHLDQVGREDHAAAVAGPVVHVQAGVVLRQVGVAAVAEDALHEIQIGDQPAGGEESRLHALFRHHAGDRGGDQRAQQERHPEFRLAFLAAGEGQAQQGVGRVHGGLEQGREGGGRNGLLVPGDRQAALDDVEHALGGAPVLLRVVQHALPDAVGGEPGRLETVRLDRQGEFRRQFRAVQHETHRRQRDAAGHAIPVEVGVDEVLDALVGRTAVVLQQATVLAVVAQQVVGDVQPVVVIPVPARLVECGELQVDLAQATQALGRKRAARAGKGAGQVVFHGGNR